MWNLSDYLGQNANVISSYQVLPFSQSEIQFLKVTNLNL